MVKDHLSQDEFFERLAALFDRRKGKNHGAIYLTQKRMTYNSPTKPEEDGPLPDAPTIEPVSQSTPAPMPIIVRATNGKSKRKIEEKIKCSTIVQPHEIDGFYVRYADICKAGMTTLKPRDRSKKRAKARKKKTT